MDDQFFPSLEGTLFLKNYLDAIDDFHRFSRYISISSFKFLNYLSKVLFDDKTAIDSRLRMNTVTIVEVKYLLGVKDENLYP